MNMNCTEIAALHDMSDSYQIGGHSVMAPLQEKVQCVLWKSRVNDVEHRRLKLRVCKLQLVQHIQPREKSQRVNI